MNDDTTNNETQEKIMVATTLETTKKTKTGSMLRSKIHLEQSYPHPRAKVWRALTEPALMQKWMMRPEGFAPVVGTKFKLVDDGPHRGWRGYVECEVLAAEPERLLKYTWLGDDKDPMQTLTIALADDGAAGTRLTLEHEGFEGIGAFVLQKLILTPGWKAMLNKKLASVLGAI